MAAICGEQQEKQQSPVGKQQKCVGLITCNATVIKFFYNRVSSMPKIIFNYALSETNDRTHTIIDNNFRKQIGEKAIYFEGNNNF